MNQSVRLPYSRKRMLDNDPKSRAIVIQHFKKQGLILHENPNTFGIDLVSDFCADGTFIGMELERHPQFKGNRFPYPVVNVPLRKCKHFGFVTPLLPLSPNEYIDHNPTNCYVVINREYTHFGIISAQRLKQYCDANKPQEVPNSFVAAGEYFFRIPKSWFVWKKFEI